MLIRFYCIFIVPKLTNKHTQTHAHSYTQDSCCARRKAERPYSKVCWQRL